MLSNEIGNDKTPAADYVKEINNLIRDIQNKSKQYPENIMYKQQFVEKIAELTLKVNLLPTKTGDHLILHSAGKDNPDNPLDFWQRYTTFDTETKAKINQQIILLLKTQEMHLKTLKAFHADKDYILDQLRLLKNVINQIPKQENIFNSEKHLKSNIQELDILIEIEDLAENDKNLEGLKRLFNEAEVENVEKNLSDTTLNLENKKSSKTREELSGYSHDETRRA